MSVQTDREASVRLGRRRVLAGSAIGVGGAVLTRQGAAAAQTSADTSVFNVRDYGAVGDFWTDDTASIQATVDAALVMASPEGGGIVWFPAGAYRIASTVKLNGATYNVFDKPITLEGVGDASVVYVHNGTSFTGGRAFEAKGQDGTRVALGSAGPAAAGARQITVPSTVASSLTSGSILGIEENVTSGFVFGTDGKPRELHVVLSKDGTTIDLDSPLLFDYTTAAVVWKMTPVPGPTIRNLAITAANDPATTTSGGVYSIVLNRATNARIENVRLFNAAGGVQLYNVVDAHVQDCTIDRLPRYDVPGEPAYGYGILVAGASANVAISNLVGRGTRHLFTTLDDQLYGGPRNVTVIGGIGEGGDMRSDGQGPLSIWDTHAYGIDISFIGCTALGAGATGHSGFQVRAKRVKIIDCVSKHNALYGVQVTSTADQVTISGGEFAHNAMIGISTGVTTRITGADIHQNGSYGINWNGSPLIHVSNCYIHDNSAPGLRDQAASGSKTPDAVITGNVIPRGTGSAQANSMTGIGGTRGVVAHNVLRGYGSGSDGTVSLESSVVKQGNVVDP